MANMDGKNLVFSDHEARNLSLKLSRDEAAAVVDEERWRQIEEWVRTSYTLVAPKKLARLVLEEDS